VDSQNNDKGHLFLGSGWSFPVAFSPGTYQLELTSYETNINDSINLILMTRMGERCFEPDFGSGLQQYFFRKMDETLKGEIMDTVKASLLHNEPRITVTEVDVEYIDLYNGLIHIFISYTYNQANTRHNYVFPFCLNEGTNL
jgi:uncharacterized protein